MSLIISNMKFVVTLHISSASLLISNKQKSSISSLFNVKTLQSVKLTFKAERAHCVICKIIFKLHSQYMASRMWDCWSGWILTFPTAIYQIHHQIWEEGVWWQGTGRGGIIRGYHRLGGNYCWHYYPKPSIRRLGHCTQCRLMITGHDAYKRLAYPQCQCQCTFGSLWARLLVNIDTFTQKPAIKLSGSWVTGCNTLRCIHSSPDLADCPAVSFVFVCLQIINIRNTNQLTLLSKTF